MTVWSDDFYTRMEKLRHQISASDFRFYNIGHLPLIARKTEVLSKKCAICKNNIKILDSFITILPECFQFADTRKIFEQEKANIEKHLQKEHNIRYPNYYYSAYSLIGAISGIITGAVISFSVLGALSINYLLIPGIIGLGIGLIVGKRSDRKKYQNNLQV